MKAVILAAGEGVRLRPITSTRSKHMIPIAGKPFIEYLLLSLKANGIREVLMVVGYRRDLIESYFGDGSKLGLSLRYIEQEGVLGTANAIGVAEKFIQGEPLLAVYGDLLVDASVISSTLQAYHKSGLTTVTAVPVSEVEKYGVFTVEGGYVTGVVEKPNRGEAPSNLANAGIYVFAEDMFDEIRRTPKSSRSEFEITDTLQQLIKKSARVVLAVADPEMWMDIGYPWDLLEATKRILTTANLEMKGTVEEGVRIVGPIGSDEGVRIRSGSYIEGPVFLGEGSDIGPNSYIRPYTSLGRRVRIGSACEVKNSLILDGTHVPHLSYVGDSIIGANCNLGAGTITGNLRLDDKSVKVAVKDRVVDSGLRKLGVIMGDNVKTAINVNFMPGVKVGANAWIGPNVTVYRDVPPDEFLLQKQELEHREVSKN